MQIKIIAGILVVIGLGGGAWYFLGTATPNMENNETEAVVTDSFRGGGSLAALMLRGKSMKCDFKGEEDGVYSEGTFYFDNKDERFRVDVESTTDGQPFATHIINNSEKVYSWGTQMEKGIIMEASMVTDSVDDSFMNLPDMQDDSGSMVDVEETVEYDCQKWKVDDSVFQPDTSVEFVDMQAMMEGLFGDSIDDFDPSIFENLEVN